jgi:DNA mismatch repair protein MutS
MTDSFRDGFSKEVVVPPLAENSPRPDDNDVASHDSRPGGVGRDSPNMSPDLDIPQRSTSLLFNESSAGAVDANREDRSFATDLNLDQIVESVAGEWEEHDLITTLLYRQLQDIDTVHYRHEVFRDLEDPTFLERVRHFTDLMREVRAHFAQLKKMQYQRQREAWFLDAAALYSDAVRSLADDLSSAHLKSRALLSFRDFLTGYVTSSAYISLAAKTKERKDALAEIRYCTRIRGGKVEVSRYEGEADYSAEVLNVFERFKQGSVKDYLVNYPAWPGMNHVGAQIVDLVARLFPDQFTALEMYCRENDEFFDGTVRQFERELQFYLAYVDYIRPLRSIGLTFCYPDVSSVSKEIRATDTFDLALAQKLASSGTPVVCNDLHLKGPERVIVVSGPNQGGKTTFARTFGQLHHLASLGCPVPGSDARLFLFDRLFTHFEREEDLANMSGKLEDDLVRIKEVLQAATTRSIVIMNEIFTSTTLSDARFLGEKVMKRIIQLDLLCVYVTFIDELASLGETVVSMVSTIVPEDPAERTFKVVRAPADGLAYALAIAEKHNLTYERLHERVTS